MSARPAFSLREALDERFEGFEVARCGPERGVETPLVRGPFGILLDYALELGDVVGFDGGVDLA